jgi:hypothetical protein
MNLDDFIITDNAASPAGIHFTQSQEALKHAHDRSSHSVASAIPIKSRKERAQHFVPQSVPAQRVQDEFGYVTRHPRKTSIDERRVCDLLDLPGHILFAFARLLTKPTCMDVDSEASRQLLTSRTCCQRQFLYQ